MDNNFDNTPEENGLEDSQPVYTDPNADVKEEDAGTAQPMYGYTQDNAPDVQKDTQDNFAGYRQGTPSQSGQSNPYKYQSVNNYQPQNSNYQYQNSNYQPQNTQYTNGQYQDNLSYNTGNNLGYNQNNYENMDTSPMTMGEWLLTILAAMIPCAGIILYIVWAFSKTGNVNRRNFCRAQLIVMAFVFVLYMVMFVVLGVSYMGV